MYHGEDSQLLICPTLQVIDMTANSVYVCTWLGQGSAATPVLLPGGLSDNLTKPLRWLG